MDLRYETREEAKEFHKQRKAFIIRNNKVEFLPENTEMSHFDYCKTKGINKEEFNKITRGYYLNGKAVFYKDNFSYDEQLINEALLHLDEISKKVSQPEFDIYFGHLPDQDFALDYYYGRYNNGEIKRTHK